VLLLKNSNKNNKWNCKFPLMLLLYLSLIFFSFSTDAQNCPTNIDFERGKFDGWTCYTGITEAIGDENLITLYDSYGPVYNRHTMYYPNSYDVDPYGGFPVLCPNGSGHSVRLGSTEAGGKAEGMSYQFTIPPNQNSYTLTYYYAVVFQQPHHRENEQPRMEIEITNVTDNSVISCASFTFIAVGSSLPGFQVSNLSDSINVLYKGWSPVSVDLSGNAGKTIKMFFKTADCTFRRHFGYAYIDVNSECNGNLVGATYCPDDTAINIVAPYGYKGYTWYDNALTNILGTQQTLTLTPPPVSGTTYAVKLEPYPGYGCPNTMFTKVTDSLTVKAIAGKDALLCNGDSIQIGTIPKQGLAYQWSPTAGLSNPEIANPVAAPNISTDYIVATSNSGGGCLTTDTVRIIASIIDSSLQVTGKDAYCFGHGDSTVLKVKPANTIEWFKDNLPISGTTNQTSYKVTQPGTYFARLTSDLGCKATTHKKIVYIDFDKAGITYPLKYAVVNLPLGLTVRPIGQTVLWSPAVNLNSPESFEPTFRGAREQLYTISITSRAGCVTTDTQLVKIIKQVEIYVPTGFTPNNDGKNDYLHPILRGVAKVQTFKIFNRWGQLLFESKDELQGWDGSFKGLPQPPQAVVWMLECIGMDGVLYSKKGSCILIR
jgi:gliding motility-associated-like protein